MSAEKNWQFELEEYIKQGEPGQIEKSEAWQTAIGLQAVDGLKTSAYLLDTAKEHIEGKISIDEAQKRIQSYYEQRTDRTEVENDTNGVFNDMLVRKNYGVLKQCIDTNTVPNIEYMIIWAEHCADESQLLWRFSFLLRLVK